MEIGESDLEKITITDINLIKRYSLQLFNAVKYLHELGITHKDIKSNNIIIKGEDIKLIDFGISNVYSKISKYNNDFEFDIQRCGHVIIDFFSKIYRKEINKSITPYELNLILKKILESNIEILIRILRSDVEIITQLYEKSEYIFTTITVKDIVEFFNIMDDLLIDLLEGIFGSELNIYECINHPWFMS